MRKGLIKGLTSGITITGLLFLLSLIYSVRAMNRTEDGLLHLLREPLFVFLYLCLLSILVVRFTGSKHPGSRFLLLGIIGIGISLLLFSNTNSPDSIILREGERIGNMEVLSLKGIPESMIVIGKEKPGGLRDIVVEMRKGNKPITLMPFPFSVVNSEVLGIRDAGISPEIEIFSGNRVLMVNKLRLLPPEKVVKVQFPEADLVLYVSIIPSEVSRKERVEVRQYNLRVPLYRIALLKKDRTLIDRVFKDGDSVSFEGISIRVSNTKRWVEIKSGSLLIIVLLGSSFVFLIAGIGISVFTGGRFYRYL